MAWELRAQQSFINHSKVILIFYIIFQCTLILSLALNSRQAFPILYTNVVVTIKQLPYRTLFGRTCNSDAGALSVHIKVRL